MGKSGLLFNGTIVMKNGTKVVSKQNLTEGKIKLGKIVAPAKIGIGIKSAIGVDKRTLAIKLNSFEATWYLDIDEEGKYKLDHPPKSKSKSMPLSSLKVTQFEKNGQVNLYLKYIVEAILPFTSDDKYEATFECIYDVEVPKKVTPKPIKRIVIPYPYVVGPYITNEWKFTKMDKKANKSKIRGMIDPVKLKSNLTTHLKKFDVESVTLYGYADSRGTELHNTGLGLDRAKELAKLVRATPGFDRKNTFVDPKVIGEPPGNKKEEDNPSQRAVIVIVNAYGN